MKKQGSGEIKPENVEDLTTQYVGVFIDEGSTDVQIRPLYRGTWKSPKQVFPNGFQAKGTNPDVVFHVDPGAGEDFGASSYVSTSTSKAAASKYPYTSKKRATFVYEINPQRHAIDVTEALAPQVGIRMSAEHFENTVLPDAEMAVPFKINSQDIKGAWRVEIKDAEFDGDIYEEGTRVIQEKFIANPNYVPPAVVRVAQAVKTFGRGVTAVGLALDGYSLCQKYEQGRETGNYRGFFQEGARVVSAWSAAVAMGMPFAKAGAEIGGALGGPWGALGGGVTGGLAGSILGYKSASALVDAVGKEKPKSSFYQRWAETSNIMDSIIAAPPKTTPPPPKMVEENNRFFKEQGVAAPPLDPDVHHKLNAILHEQKRFHTEQQKQYEEQKKTQDQRHKDQLEREEITVQYQGMQAGFQAVQALGVQTGNETVAKIGSIGASATSIAFSVAALTGAIPGLAFTGWGLMIPYAGIALAGMSIIGTLFGKKKEDKATKAIMEALHALSEQLHALKKEMRELFEKISHQIHDEFRDMDRLLNSLHNIVQAILTDGFESVLFKLDEIQSDLSRLNTLVEKGLKANYLQKFIETVSNIEQIVTASERNDVEIKKELRTVTTWLTEPAVIKNTNGHWVFPEAISSETVFAAHHLRDHAKYVDGNTSMRLGYLAALSGLIPKMEFTDVSLTTIPNIALFSQGIEAYMRGRLHIGASGAHVFDPKNTFLLRIKETSNNGLRWLEQLSQQEYELLNSFLTQYEARYYELCEALKSAAVNRLKTKILSGFEASIHDPLNTSIEWPTDIQSTKPGYPDLPFEKVKNAIVKQGNLQIARLLQKALKDLTFGKIVALYTPNLDKPAKGDSAGQNHNYRHWVQGRGVSYKVDIYYEYSGTLFKLYSVSGAHKEGELEATPFWKHKDQQPEWNKFNAKAAVYNGEPALQAFALTAWGVASLSAITDVTAAQIPDALLGSIYNEVTNRCIVQPNAYPAERAVITTAILNQATLLNDIPRDLAILKLLMIQYAKLLNAPLLTSIQTLWDEQAFYAHAMRYHDLQAVIADFKTSLEDFHTQPKVARAKTPIQQHLSYASELMAFLQQHEQISLQRASTKLIEDLGVPKDLIFNPDRIDATQLTQKNKLGAGSFGQVYRGTDSQTGELVAIKILFPGGKLHKDAQGELDVMRRLAHTDTSTHLVKIFGVTRLLERDAIVMEYVANGTLEYHLHESEPKLAWEYCLPISQQMIAALDFLHSQNITHGDFKSANVLLTADYKVKIADYGLSLVAASTQKQGSSRSRSQLSQTQAGTFVYRAPELIEDETLDPNQASDVYALGVVLWEILTRRRPFDKTNGSDAAILSFWFKVFQGMPVIDHFAIPAEPDAQQSELTKQVHAFLAPRIRAARAIEPDQRPTAAALR